jgi:hypothetical protein
MSPLRETVGVLRSLLRESGTDAGSYLELVKHASDLKMWFRITGTTKKGFKGQQVAHWLGDRKPEKSKQAFVQQIELDQGHWKVIQARDLPPEVLARFDGSL